MFQGKSVGDGRRYTTCAPRPRPPTLLSIFTFILARGCFCGLTRGFDRRHPLPVRPLNWAPTSQPGLMCQESRITTNYEPPPPLCLLPTPSSTHHTPPEQQSTALCSHFSFHPSTSRLFDSASLVVNINRGKCGEGKGKDGGIVESEYYFSWAKRKNLIKIRACNTIPN